MYKCVSFRKFSLLDRKKEPARFNLSSVLQRLMSLCSACPVGSRRLSFGGALVLCLPRRKPKAFLWGCTGVLVILCSSLISFSAYSLPQGENLIAGRADFHRGSNTLTVNVHTDKMIANYKSFSIAQPETVRFNQPSSNSVALNRVVGVEPSSIMGTLTANGKIFLINPNGILFSPNSRVDTAGLIASTLNISDNDFLAGRYTFYGQGGSIVNQGYISAPGGYVALLGSSVENSGTIEATVGSVVLASGEAITLNLDPQGLISVVIDEATTQNLEGKDSAVKNTGTISADGGKVILTAKVLNGVFDKAVNNEGIIEANSLVEHNGIVKLLTEEGIINNVGSLMADGSIENPDGGRVSLDGRHVVNQGYISSNASELGQAGKIDLVSQDEILLTKESLIEAKIEGERGEGGNVYINSLNGNTIVRKNSLIDVGAGSVAGNAGFIEISAAEDLGFQGELRGVAQEGYSGGRVLFDPRDITIVTGGVDSVDEGDNATGIDEEFGESPGSNLTFNPSSAFIGFNEIYLQATRNIKVNSAFDVPAAVGDTGTAGLKLEAGDDIDVNASIIGGIGFVILYADDNIDIDASVSTTSGNIELSAGDDLDIDAAVSTTSGTITLSADDNLIIDDGDIIGGTGAVNITADADGTGGGYFRQSSGADITTNNADITIAVGDSDSGENAQIRVINAGSGNVTISSNNGSIHEPESNASLLTGSNISLTAKHGIGTSSNYINTSASSISAHAVKTGGIYVEESDSVTLTDVDTYKGDIKIISGGNMVASDVQSDTGVSGGSHDITLTASSGDITAGTISSDDDVTITATTGSILDDSNDSTKISSVDDLTLRAQSGIGTDVSQGEIDTAVGDLYASVKDAGSMYLTEDDAITLKDIDTNNGSITIASGGNITTKDIVAGGDGNVSLTTTGEDIDIISSGSITASGNIVTLSASGKITDTSSSDSRIKADTLNISSADSVGANEDELDTEVSNISASVTGDIYIEQSGNTPVTLTNLTTTNGLLYIESDQNMTVNSLTAGGSGKDITLKTTGTNKDLILSGSVTANDTVTLTSTGKITDTTDSTSKITAGTLNITKADSVGATGEDKELDTAVLNMNIDINGGIFIKQTGSIILTTLSASGTNKNIILTTISGGNIYVGSVKASRDTITLTSAGNIEDDVNDSNKDITAGTLILNASTGIGQTNGSLDIDVATLNVSTSSGGIAIDEKNDLTISGITRNGAAQDTSISCASRGSDITISGNVNTNKGNLNLSTNNGITISDAVNVATSGGDVNFDANNDDHGGGKFIVEGTGSLNSGGGDIQITAYNIDLSNNSNINSGTGNIQFIPSGSNRKINLGQGRSNFNITDVELDRIVTSGTLTIGDSSSGSITVGEITPDHLNLSLIGTDIDIKTSIKSGAKNLSLIPSGTGRTIALAADVGSFKLSNDEVGKISTTGTLTVGDTNSGTITVGNLSQSGLNLALITGDAIQEQGADPGADITASSLYMQAVNGIGDGNPINPIETEVSSLEAHNTSGNIEIDNTGILTLQDLDGNNPLAAVSNTGGKVNISAASPLNVNADVNASGDITLQAIDDGEDDDNLMVANAANIQSTGGSGLITLEAGHDVLLQSTGSVKTGGNIHITADYDNSGSGSISQTAGNIQANTLTLSAFGSITADQPFNDADILNASSFHSGNIQYKDIDDVVLNNVTNANGSITVTAGGKITAASVITTGGADTDDINLTTTSGNIEVGTISATPDGDVKLTSAGAITAAGNNSMITADQLSFTAAGKVGDNTHKINTTVAEILNGASTAAGDIYLNEADDILLTSLTNSNGLIDVTAGGKITAASVITTGGADTDDITLTTTSGNIEVGTISAAPDGDVSLNSAGAITAAGNNSMITADQLSFTAAGKVGDNTHKINTTVAEILNGASTAAGDIYLNEADDILLTSLTNSNGLIDVTAGGKITAADVDSSTTDDGTNNIALTSTGAGIEAHLINAGAQNGVTLDAGGAITENSDTGADVIADVLTADAVIGIDLDTNITTLDATNTGTTGNIQINEVAAGGNIDVANINQTNAAGNGNTLLTTEDGLIDVLVAPGAGVTTIGTGTITLTTNHVSNTADVDVNNVVTSTVGTIQINTDRDINLAADVKSDTGDINLTAARDIGQTSISDITTAGDVTALANGSYTMADDGTDSASISAKNVNITATTGNITLGGLTATAKAYLNAGLAIIDGGDVLTDITANTAELLATTGIGDSTTLETQVSYLHAYNNKSAGNINIVNTGDLTATSVVNSGGNIVLSVKSNLTLGSIEAVGNTVTLDADGGDIIDDGDDSSYIWAKDLIINNANNVGNSSANEELDTRLSSLQIDATGDIYVKEVSVSEGNALSLHNISGKNVNISTSNGNLTLAGSYTLTASGNAALTSSGNLTLNGSINAQIVNLSADQDIVDTSNDTTKITADTLNITSAQNVGGSENNEELDTNVSTLNINGVTGSIYLKEFDNLDVNSLGVTGDINLTGSNINVINDITLSSLLTINGNLTLNASGKTFNASGGNIDLNGNFNLSDGTFNAPSGNFNLAGNFNHTAGIFTHNSGTVIFDGTAGTQTLDNGVSSFHNLIHSGTGTLQLAKALKVNNNLTNSAGTFDANGHNIDVNGSFILSDGTFNAPGPAKIFNIAGDFTITGGAFNHNNGTIIFAGAGSQRITSGDASFYNLTLANTDTNITALDDLTLDTGGALTINSEVTLDIRGKNLTIPTTLTNNGLITTSGAGNNLIITPDKLGDVTFTGSASQLPTKIYNTLTLQNGGASSGDITADTLNLTGGTFTLGGSFNTANADISNGATLGIGGNNLTISATLNNAGLITTSGAGNNLIITPSNLGDVTFTGSASQLPTKTYNTLTLQNGGASSGAITADTLNLTSGTFTLGYDFNTTDAVIGNGATLNANGRDIAISGDWTNSGTFMSGSGTVIFDGAAGTQTLDNGVSSFHNLIHSGTGTLQLAKALTVDNNLTNSAGTFDANGHNIDVNGSFILSDGTFNAPGPAKSFNIAGDFTITGGAFNHNNGTIIFAGAGSQRITSGDASFYNLKFNGENGEWALKDALDVGNNLTIDRGILNIQDKNLTVTGVLANNSILKLVGLDTQTISYGNFAGSGTVEYCGGDAYSGLKLGYTYNNLTFSGTGSYSLKNDLNVNGSLNSASTIDTNGKTIDVADSFTNTGKVTTSTGNIDIAAGEMTTGLIINGYGDITLETTSGNMSVDDLNADSNKVVLTSAQAVINDLAEGIFNINATDLVIAAQTGIGSNNPLETQVSNLQARNSTSGNIEIASSGELTLADLASLDYSVDNANGNIIISASSPLNVNADVNASGDITLQAIDDGEDDDNLMVANAANIQSTGGSGLITLEAGHDVLLQSTGSVKTGGNIHITADYDNSGSGSISQTAGNIQANTLTLSAFGSITADQPFNDADILNASSFHSGNIQYKDIDDVVLNNVTNANGSITVTAGGKITAASVITTGGANTDDITLTTTSGNIEVGTISATPDGDVSLTSAGAITAADKSSMITADQLSFTAAGKVGDSTNKINTTVAEILNGASTAAGDIYLNEADDILLTSLTNSNGLIDVTAGGKITAVDVDSSTTDDGTNNIALTSTGAGIEAQLINAGAQNDVTLDAQNGAITENSDTGADVIADVLTADVTTGIDLDTTIAGLDASVSGTGDINIDETGAISLTDVDTADGSIRVTAGGKITAASVITTGGADTDDINLTTTSGNIEVGTISATPAGDVNLNSAGAITAADKSSMITADQLSFTAAGKVGDSTNKINTTVAEILNGASTAAGDIYLNEADGILLTSLTNSNGLIDVTAGGKITAVGAIRGTGKVSAVCDNGDLTISGSFTSTGNGVDLTSSKGDILVSGGGVHLTANGNSSLNAPKGKITPTGDPLNVLVTGGDLILNLPNYGVGFTHSVYGNIVGTVSPGPRPLVQPSSMAGLNPPGYIYFNGTQIWPLVNSGVLYLSSELMHTLGSAYFEQTSSYRVSTADTAMPLFFAYHPILNTDESAFDDISLDVGAYEFINDNINLKKPLAPYFGGTENKNKKKEEKSKSL